MKVLVVNWRDIFHPEAGGAEVHIHELLKRKPPDWEVDFLSARFHGCQTLEKTPWYTIYRLFSNFFLNFSFFWWWQTQGKQKSYDLVIDDISKIPLATPWYIKEVPVVALMHHIHGKSLYTILPWYLATYVFLMERFFLRAYVRTPLLAVSPSTTRELQKLYPYQKLSVVYNGVSLAPISFETKIAEREKVPLVVYLGRLKSYKRVDHFLRMAHRIHASHPQVKFVIAGQGEEREKLEKLSKDLGLEGCVEFYGFIDEEAKQALLRRAWVMVLPSEKEGWGIVVIEANALGTPVVAYEIPGLKDSIQHGNTGLLVENGSIEALVKAVEKLLEESSLWEEFSKKALEWAARFHWDEMARDFYARIGEIVEEFHGRKTL
ncbi:glycosyltransferase family 4 protein [Thermospira aquatica]|uniref:Glycosyltransferase family 4 protein n=1 Tax=Thermospira aquatica TaxID=2828656 RepID=A0AAX3BC45_9SPIR|nr:glycosyltransferase family 4 protein [Thermospira aquatica]URA09854.1 glycosyltransferase family 4 protein [Thermospira aquatica]